MATEIDKELQAALKQAKGGKPMQFAFLAKGTGGSLLAAKKLTPATVAEAKKKEAGSTLFRGRLVGEDGQFVFEVAKEPPPALAAQLKRAIKEHAGLTGEVVVRVKADAADGPPPEAPGQEPPAPSPAPSAGRGPVMARLQRLAPQMKAALVGPSAARVQILFGAVNGLVKKSDFARANKVIDELEPLVTAAPGAVPPPTPRRPPPPGGTEQAGKFKAELARLTPHVQRCLKEQLGDTGKIRAVMAFVQEKAAAGEFGVALQGLTRLAALIPAEAPPDAAWRAEYAALEPRYLETLKGQPATADKMRALMGFANSKAEAGEFAKALGALKALAPLVAEALAGTAGKATDVIPAGTVAAMREALSRAKERWDKAVTDAAAQIRKVQEGVRPDDLELADHLDEVAAEYEGRLDVLVGLARQADADDCRKRALEMVRELHADVLGDKVLAYLDTYEAATIELRGTFVKALEEVRQHLSA